LIHRFDDLNEVCAAAAIKVVDEDRKSVAVAWRDGMGQACDVVVRLAREAQLRFVVWAARVILHSGFEWIEDCLPIPRHAGRHGSSECEDRRYVSGGPEVRGNQASDSRRGE
jgi:hypothetical protein